MELCVLWILAKLFAFNTVLAYGRQPIPVLYFEKSIIEEEDTSITCVFPCDDCQDVELFIMANSTSLTDCSSKKGKNPNVTCVVEVTREMHEMEFTCEARFKTQSLPQKMMINIEPEFTNCSDKLVWLEGEKNSFNCKAIGYPLPTLTCYINNINYSEGEEFMVWRNMSGEAICTAINSDKVSKKITVSVEYKPKILSVKVNSALRKEGDNVEITCEADGSPHPTYSWNIPSNNVQFSSDNQTVTVKSLQNSHLGKYKCIAQNKHGTDTREEALFLAVKPNVSKIKVEPSTQVLEGESVTMTCEASGIPTPLLGWTTPTSDVQLSPDNRTLTIKGVKKSHVGTYICKSENQYGSHTQSQSLSLGVKPQKVQIKVQPSTSVKEGANVTLKCEAEGVPPPTYSWDTPNKDVQISANKSVVYILHAQMIHNGDYRCNVENKFGSANQTQRISIEAKSTGGSGVRTTPTVLIIMADLFISLLFYYLY